MHDMYTAKPPVKVEIVHEQTASNEGYESLKRDIERLKAVATAPQTQNNNALDYSDIATKIMSSGIY